MTFLEPLMNQGSLTGTMLLIYAVSVSALCAKNAKDLPQSALSGIERSPLNLFMTLICIPMFIWVLVYLVGYLGFLKGISVWLVIHILTTIAILIAGFKIFPGIHLLLSSVAMVIGAILTIRTHPF